MADFFERVDTVAAAQGVSKVEVRGNCCVCVAGAEGAVPYAALAAAPADPRHDQATRMLAFAASLHDDLRSTHAVSWGRRHRGADGRRDGRVRHPRQRRDPHGRRRRPTRL
jgi:hypothetical protein